MFCKLVWCKKTEGPKMKWYTETFNTPDELFIRAEALFRTSDWHMMERHVYNDQYHTYSREYNN